MRKHLLTLNREKSALTAGHSPRSRGLNQAYAYVLTLGQRTERSVIRYYWRKEPSLTSQEFPFLGNKWDPSTV